MKKMMVIVGILLIIAGLTAAWGRSTPPPARLMSAMAQDGDVDRLSAGELRNKPVYDRRSEKIAVVSEVTGTPGQMRQAILYTGGVFGVGGQEVALPLDKLGIGTDGKLVLAAMTQDQLKLLPRYR